MSGKVFSKRPKATPKKPARKEPRSISIKIEKPICSQEDYGASLGLSAGAVRGQVERKLIPTIRIGKKRYINLAKLTLKCLEAEDNA